MAWFPYKGDRVISDIDVLEEPFRSECKKLIRALEGDPETAILEPFETLRTEERQKYLFANKKSRTLKSKHLRGFACDFVPHNPEKGWSWANRDITGDGTTEDEMRAFVRMREIVKERFPKLRYLGEWDMAHIELRT